MRRWKWRIALSAGNLLLAIGMSAIGLREWAIDSAHHVGGIGYEPTAQWLSYCINAPPFAFTNLLLNFAMGHHLLPSGWWDVHCFHFVRYEYYVALFLLWWWIGWKIDMKLAARESGRSWTIAESSIGLVLSLMLLFVGSMDVGNDYGIHAVAWSMVGWGTVLMYYFLVYLWPMRLRRTAPRVG
jgi:hypothetical protein